MSAVTTHLPFNGTPPGYGQPGTGGPPLDTPHRPASRGGGAAPRLSPANDAASVDDARRSVAEKLSAKAKEGDAAFHDFMRSVFGAKYDPASPQAKGLLKQVRAGDFSFLPPARFVPDADMNGGLAAYAEGKIYLNETLKNDPKARNDFYLEEVGHFIDDKVLGGADTKGDEGAVFRLTLNKEDQTVAQKAEIAAQRAENDEGTITVDGRQVEVEFGFLSKLDPTKAIKKVAGKIKDAASDAWKGIKEGASDAWKGIKDGVKSAISSAVEFIGKLPGGEKLLETVGKIMKIPGIDIILSVVANIFLPGAGGVLTGMFSKVFGKLGATALGKAVTGALGAVGSYVGQLAGKLGATSLGKAVTGMVGSMGTAIGNWTGALGKQVAGGLSKAAGGVMGWLEKGAASEGWWGQLNAKALEKAGPKLTQLAAKQWGEKTLNQVAADKMQDAATKRLAQRLDIDAGVLTAGFNGDLTGGLEKLAVKRITQEAGVDPRALRGEFGDLAQAEAIEHIAKKLDVEPRYVEKLMEKLAA